MKIGILSDTHSYMDDRILHHLSDVDEIWHGGDIGNFATVDALAKLKPVKAVYGNIDSADLRTEYPLNNIFTCEEARILITHIAGYPGKYNPRVRALIAQNKPDIVVCGHSHILKVMRDAHYGHIHINPGAAGIHGFHAMRTLIKMEIQKTKIVAMNVVELGLRAALDN